MSTHLSLLLEQFRNLRIVVVGDVMVDHYVSGDVSRISPEAPVPVVKVENEFQKAGGAANVAVNLAAMGVETELVGRVGADDAGSTLKSILADSGVQMSVNWMRSGVRTIVKTRVVARTQQICRFDHEDPANSYEFGLDAEFQEQLKATISDADAVILSDYAKGCVTQDLYDLLAEFTGQSGTLLAVDPKPSRQLNFHSPGLITPNQKEALELADLPANTNEPFPARKVCQCIRQKFDANSLVITLGSDGMLVVEDGKVVRQLSTQAKEVFDVSGAGDTVIATLTAALATGAHLVDAAQLANIAAGIVVGKFGTAVPARNELAVALEDRVFEVAGP